MDTPRNSGFSLIELLVVVAVLSVLLSILTPIVTQTLETARDTTCLTQQRSIYGAMKMYLADHDDLLPACWVVRGLGAPKDTYWVDRLSPYLGGADLSGNSPHPRFGYNRSAANEIFRCPAAENHHYIADYGINSFVVGLHETSYPMSVVTQPVHTLLFCDARHPSWWGAHSLEWGSWYVHAQEFVPPGRGHSEPADRHRSRVGGVFCDGHTEFIRGTDLLERRASLFGTWYFALQ